MRFCDQRIFHKRTLKVKEFIPNCEFRRSLNILVTLKVRFISLGKIIQIGKNHDRGSPFIE